MLPHEERIIRGIFERLAGRRLTHKEVEDIVENIKVTAEIIRSTDWLRQELGLDPLRKARKKRRR